MRQTGVGLLGIPGIPTWTTQPLITQGTTATTFPFVVFALFSVVHKLLPPAHGPFSTDKKADLVRDAWGVEENERRRGDVGGQDSPPMLVASLARAMLRGHIVGNHFYEVINHVTSSTLKKTSRLKVASRNISGMSFLWIFYQMPIIWHDSPWIR